MINNVQYPSNISRLVIKKVKRNLKNGGFSPEFIDDFFALRVDTAPRELLAISRRAKHSPVRWDEYHLLISQKPLEDIYAPGGLSR